MATEDDNNNMRQLEALMYRMDEMRAAHQRPEDRSPRTPNNIFTQNNAADQLERQLRADGHRIWGFVIYRCTYASDTAWRECIEHIRASRSEAMDFYNGHDLLEEGHFALTVIQDASTLDGASSQVVRRHFEDWCARMEREEQGSEDEIEARRGEKASPYDSLLPQRYRFCIQIDDASWQSVNSQSWKGWVKLLNRDWQSKEATAAQQQPEEERAPGGSKRDVFNDKDSSVAVELDEEVWARSMSYSGPVLDKDFTTSASEVSTTDEGDFADDEGDEEEEYPAIEGCTDHDVGWMKVQLVDLMPDRYVDLRDPNAWSTSYIRPPDVA